MLPLGACIGSIDLGFRYVWGNQEMLGLLLNCPFRLRLLCCYILLSVDELDHRCGKVSPLWSVFLGQAKYKEL